MEMVTSAGCRMLEEGVKVTRLRVDIGHLHLGSALEDPDTRSADHKKKVETNTFTKQILAKY